MSSAVTIKVSSRLSFAGSSRSFSRDSLTLVHSTAICDVSLSGQWCHDKSIGDSLILVTIFEYISVNFDFDIIFLPVEAEVLGPFLLESKRESVHLTAWDDHVREEVAVSNVKSHDGIQGSSVLGLELIQRFF
jgi:hypothetical protein